MASTVTQLPSNPRFRPATRQPHPESSEAVAVGAGFPPEFSPASTLVPPFPPDPCDPPVATAPPAPLGPSGAASASGEQRLFVSQA
jgi:hypothetical protein